MCRKHTHTRTHAHARTHILMKIDTLPDEKRAMLPYDRDPIRSSSHTRQINISDSAKHPRGKEKKTMQNDKENVCMSTPPQPRRRRSIYEQDPDQALGKIALFPSAYQCHWLGRDHLVYGSINWHDGTTVETDEGDCFESLGHWVQAEQRRELTRLQMQSLMQSLNACPDTPAPFSRVVDEPSTDAAESPSAYATTPGEGIKLDTTNQESFEPAAEAYRMGEEEEEEEEEEDEPFFIGDDKTSTTNSELWVLTNNDEYDFENPNDPGAFLHESLTKQWAEYLPKEEQQEDEDKVKSGTNYDLESPRSSTDVARQHFGANMDVTEAAESPKKCPSGPSRKEETAPSPGLQLLRSALVLDTTVADEDEEESADENVQLQMNPFPPPMISSKVVNMKDVTAGVNKMAIGNRSRSTKTPESVNAALAVFQSILNDSSWKDQQPDDKSNYSLSRVEFSDSRLLAQR